MAAPLPASNDCESTWHRVRWTARDNAADAVTKAEQAGAKLLIPPTVLPEGDTMAVLHDPQGMSFAVWQARLEFRPLQLGDFCAG